MVYLRWFCRYFNRRFICFFLKSLEKVTALQVHYSWLLFLLPLAGAFISYLYKDFGKNAHKGNNLVIEQAIGGEEKIPLRLIPLTLIGTLATHLFGGSLWSRRNCCTNGWCYCRFCRANH